jgi:hypothetical protein
VPHPAEAIAEIGDKAGGALAGMSASAGGLVSEKMAATPAGNRVQQIHRGSSDENAGNADENRRTNARRPPPHEAGGAHPPLLWQRRHPLFDCAQIGHVPPSIIVPIKW